MSPVPAVIVITVLVLVTTAVGLLARSRSGRAAHPRAAAPLTAAALDTTEQLGSAATLVQFSTEYCAKCPGTRRLLHELAGVESGVRVVEIDLTHRPDLADRFSVLQTPTILLLDRAGTVQSRFAGTAQRAILSAELRSVLGSTA